jgi:hypothetical protein
VVPAVIIAKPNGFSSIVAVQDDRAGFGSNSAGLAINGWLGFVSDASSDCVADTR